ADDPALVRMAMADATVGYRSFLSSHSEAIALFQSGDRIAATTLALGPGRVCWGAAQAAFATAALNVVKESAAETAHDGALTDLASKALIALGLGLLIVAAEVTRRVRKQRLNAEALRDSEQHFRTLVDHVPAAVYAVDLDGVVLAWNPV